MAAHGLNKMGITFQRTPIGKSFLRSSAQARITDNVTYSRAQIAIAMVPFSGLCPFSSMDSSGNITYQQVWPNVYTTLTEVWNGSTTVTTVYQNDYFLDVLSFQSPTVTGSRPGGDYYSTSSFVTNTTISSTGPSGSYSATLSNPADWEIAAQAADLILSGISYPTEPSGTSTFTFVYNSGIDQPFRKPLSQVNLTQKLKLADGSINEYYLLTPQNYITVAGACGRGVPYIGGTAADYFVSRNKNIPTISEGSIVSDNYNNKGYCISYKSRWKIFGNFNSGKATDNQNDHQNIYMMRLDPTLPNFGASGVTLPNPLILSTPAPASIPQPVQRGIYQFTPADFLANAGGYLHGELGFRSVKI